jgi:hypothetical protein
MSGQPAKPPLDPKVRELLIKLAWMIDNTNPHERAVAGEKFIALLKHHNLTVADVLAPPAINQVIQIVHPNAPASTPPQPPPPRDWHMVVTDIWVNRRNALYEKELTFLPDLLNRARAPRGGQIPWLIKIIRRTRVRPWDVKPWDVPPGDTSPWDYWPGDTAS